MLYDTHLHLIYPDKLRYPWLESFEVLNKPSIFDSYLTRARRVGITACLHMEVDVAENQIKEETALVADLMARPQSPMRGAISACRPEHPNFPEFLDWARTVPTIKGFRRVLHVMPDELSQTDTFRNNISRLTGTGLTFDLCVLPHQLVWAGQLIDHCPDVTFILNHCGVPDVKGGEIEPWGGRLSELAKRPNVLCQNLWTDCLWRPLTAGVWTTCGHSLSTPFRPLATIDLSGAVIAQFAILVEGWKLGLAQPMH
jgi:predicted TIM-barrel fold metal-dependent hydrolase